ncbi:MAG: glycosyltransferase family 2 protein [Acidimicrobiia bacterium]
MASLLVIVPAYNEEACIGAVVHDARTILHADVAVIDDGSTDATGLRAAAAGARVVTLPFNLGVGGAIRTGLRYAVDRGYQRVVQLDGDGQHDVAEAKRLLDELEGGGADLVVGARFAAGYDVSRTRRLAMRILSRIVSRRLGTSVSDTTSGFRAMGPRAIALFARRYPVDYLSDTVEALLIAGDAGLAVREVDVRMRPRQGGVPSASRPRSAYHLARLLIGVLVRATRGRAAPEVPT